MRRIRDRLAAGDLHDAGLQERLGRLPPRFADSDELLAGFLTDVRRLAAQRVGLRPFDVQLQAAAAMLRGISVEMATGEGKTLVGAITAAGLVVAGHRVHVLAANDYLAERDAAWMTPLLSAVGASVGWVTSRSDHGARRAAYQADVTYVPVTEVGFDTLRDRVCLDVADQVGVCHGAAIVDEADAVLLDEARVPLVLAGEDPSRLGADWELPPFVASLVEDVDFVVDADRRTLHLTEHGLRRVERRFPGVDLFGADQDVLTRVHLALHAESLLRRDVDYVVDDGRVRLVSQSRGRTEALQRWPDGLQAAVEAKERVMPSVGVQVIDQILVSELVGQYTSVIGMSATLMSAAEELYDLYQLRCATVPPNRPCIRVDEPDRLYATTEARNAAAAAFVADRHTAGQPVLVATQSVAESELFGRRLTDGGLEVAVLNAKNDAEEATLIARAGASGRITVSTQMAGRGTDIRLDHDAGRQGGLYVVGLGRFPSRRLDQQLRGRAGRQGDPGGSVYFVSLHDNLIIENTTLPPRLGDDEQDEPITDSKLSSQVDHAQRSAEAQQQELRRLSRRYGQLLATQRRQVLELRRLLLTTDCALRMLVELAPRRVATLSQELGRPALVQPARILALSALDHRWTGHLDYATGIREGIHLRALAREDPLTEFNRLLAEAFRPLITQAWADAAHLIEEAPIVDGVLSLDAIDLHRPGATWTYMVTDNHFGSEWERIGRFINRHLLARQQRR